MSLERDGEIRVRFNLENEGDSSIFLMTQQPWRVRSQGGSVLLAYGDPYINFGNSFPALQEIAPGEVFGTEAVLELPMPLDEAYRVDLYFYGIFDGAAEAGSIRDQVDVSSGLWQTGSLSLAHRYHELLVEFLISLPLTEALKAAGKAPAPEAGSFP